MEQRNKNHGKRWKAALIAALTILCAVAGAFTSWAWLSNERRAAAIVAVDVPMSIVITAGNQNNAQYLDLSNIDKATGAYDETEGKYYKDYVFAVTGTYLNAYKLQLAYTTNNQFTYKIYKAYKATAAEIATAQSLQGYVKYQAKIDSQPTFYHQIADSPNVPMTLLNASNDPMVAVKSGDFYATTYGTYDVSKVDPYAMPLYLHSGELAVRNRIDNGAVVDYFILRVYWTGNQNTRETDMIYISAKAV